MIKILVGNIATGKTTYAKKYCNGDKWLVWDPDCVREMFHSGKYVFDKDEAKIIDKMRNIFLIYALKNDFHICLDDAILTISRSSREKLLKTIKHTIEFLEKETEIVAVDLGPGNLESLKRRNKEHRGHANWDHVHNKFFELYEMPLIDEGFNKIEKVNNE